jgi:hypothetical protein
MRNICIISTPLYSYHNQLLNAFNRAGCNCSVFSYKIPNRYLNKIPVFNVFYRFLFRITENNRLFKSILGLSKLDFLIFFGMCEMPGHEINKIKHKTGAFVIFWFIDSISRHKGFFNAIPYCDYAITYKKSDNEFFTSRRINNSFLPLFFDPECYFKKNTLKTLDIFFVGALKSRISFLNEMAKEIDHLNLNIAFYGRLSRFYILTTKHQNPWFYKYHFNRSLSHKDINDLYNSSRLCINLQPSQATDALNIRTFEIFGSGALLLTDGNYKLLSEYFNIGVDLIRFDSIDELIGIIIDYFGPQKLYVYNSINQEGSKTRINHTVDNRVKEVMNLIPGND